jgi:hypothetical protein
MDCCTSELWSRKSMNPYEADQWQEVSSSNIYAVGTIDDDLIVMFKNKDAYRYPGLAGEYDTLISAPSVGSYFAKEIRHQACQKLGRDVFAG